MIRETVQRAERLLLVLAALGALGLLGALSQGCGASALAVQADLVAMGGIAASEAEEVLLAAYEREKETVKGRARAECGEGSCSPETQALHAARLEAVVLDWRPTLACREPVVQILHGWADAIDTALAGSDEDIGLGLVALWARRFITAWTAFDQCIDAAVPNVELPGLPRKLIELLGVPFVEVSAIPGGALWL